MAKTVKIDFRPILEYQEDLDNLILQHNGVSYAEIKQKHRLALMAELMELCNETRCFNYWSTKRRATDDQVLAEFADVLSFTFSEALQSYHLAPDTVLEFAVPEKSDDREVQTMKFLEIIHLYDQKGEDVAEMKQFIIAIIQLGYLLGYDWTTQWAAHEKKCERFRTTQH